MLPRVAAQARVALVAVLAAGSLVATATGPAVAAADPSEVLWSAGMEDGSLAEWRSSGGGGDYNSGSGDSMASRALARTGAWAVKATLSDGAGGTRLFRWKEARENREAYYSVWVFLPREYRLTADPDNGQYLDLFQFKSRSVSGRNDPLWAAYAHQTADGLKISMGWGWGGTPVAGPRSSDGVGGKNFPTTAPVLPTGRWVHLEAFLRQSPDHDGRVTFWQDGVEAFDMTGVRTSFRNCLYNSWCGSNEWSANLYSDGMSPTPTMYLDDAAISRTRVSVGTG